MTLSFQLMHMNIKFTFKNVSEGEKKTIEEYASSKIENLAEYLKRDLVDEDTVLVDVRMERFQKHSSWKADIMLTVKHDKARIFKATETKHSYTEAIDAVRDMLQDQIVKAKDKLLDK